MSKEKGRIKVRFFEVELEGSDDTLLESVKSAAALANRSHVRTVKQLAPAPVNASEEEVVEESPVIGEENNESSSPADKPKKKRSYSSPKIVDIDLKGGEMPFEKFVESAKPNDTTKKYLVVAVWFKRYRNTPMVTIDHVYTCSRAVNWGVLADVNQPFRSAQKQGYFRGNSKGYEVTHVGEGVVDKLLNPPEE